MRWTGALERSMVRSGSMTQIVLDIDPDLANRLELRAKRLGTTVQREASRLIRERLEAEPAVPSGTGGAEEAVLDPRFVQDHGFLIFAGEVSPDAIPDHRTLQDERIDTLVKDACAGRL
jgi:hypothetical protein